MLKKVIISVKSFTQMVGDKWRPKVRSSPAYYHLVSDRSDVNDKASASSALSFKSYLINEALHNMILVWPIIVNLMMLSN
jgi:hypothetical protein